MCVFWELLLVLWSFFLTSRAILFIFNRISRTSKRGNSRLRLGSPTQTEKDNTVSKSLKSLCSWKTKVIKSWRTRRLRICRHRLRRLRWRPHQKLLWKDDPARRRVPYRPCHKYPKAILWNIRPKGVSQKRLFENWHVLAISGEVWETCNLFVSSKWRTYAASWQIFQDRIIVLRNFKKSYFKAFEGSRGKDWWESARGHAVVLLL